MIKQKVKYNSPMAYYQIAKSIKKFITKKKNQKKSKKKKT